MSILLLPAFRDGLAQEDPFFKATSFAGLLDVRVLDSRGRIVEGLVAEDFLLSEEGREQRVQLLEEHGGAHLTLALLIDRGSNMSSKNILRGKQFFLDLIHLLSPKDQVLVATYDRDIHFLSPLTQSRRVLVEGLENLASGGRPSRLKRLSKLFASSSLAGWAIDSCLMELKESRASNKVVLIVSAGTGNIGVGTQEHLLTAGARLVSIDVGSPLADAFSLWGDRQAGRRAVRRSGGLAYGALALTEGVERVRDTLKHFYILGYSPPEGRKPLAGRALELTIRGRPDLRVHFGRRTSSSSSIF